MKALIDTNILIDYLTSREPFYENAARIMSLCLFKINGCVSPHSFIDIAYVLRENFNIGIEDVRNIIQKFSAVLQVATENKDVIVYAAENENFSDYEDSVQNECARTLDVDCIVTRNKKDFANASVPVLEPKEFLDMF